MRLLRYTLPVVLLLALHPAFAADERPLHVQLEDAWNAYSDANKGSDLDKLKVARSERGLQVAWNDVIDSRQDPSKRMFDRVSAVMDLKRLTRASTTQKGPTTSSIYYLLPPAPPATPPAAVPPSEKDPLAVE